MIAHLRGTLLEKHPNQAIVEAQGVGYDVAVPVSTFAALPEPGAEVKLKIHTVVREDAIQLFGFLTAEEKALFEKLITVSGVGPRLALTVLSGIAAPDLAGVIRSADVQKLTRVPGIGKKTAERIVLELRDKIDESPRRAAGLPGAPAVILSQEEADVVSALVNLGAQRAAAETAARRAAQELAGRGFEEMFRRALELLR
ncbi:MAG: Holliday junction ATP-dependent DNA helicase RuvA [Bryobacteraceae bacterium]|nr:MAG: Holliday junction ATP-dependent DNA helicase RuvA [Bryobacteraceae bacterium]